MVKTIQINDIFTPLGNVIAANAIIGNVTPDKIRFSPGSLASSVLANSNARQLLMISFSTLAAFTISGVNHAAEITGHMQGLNGFAGTKKIVAADSTGKTKTLTFPGIIADQQIVVSVNDGATGVTDPLALHLLTPDLPSYTLLSLLNEIESFLLARAETHPLEGKGFVLIVDQFDESVTVHQFDTVEIADAAALFVLGEAPLLSLTLNAVFDMAVETNGSGPSVTRFGWE